MKNLKHDINNKYKIQLEKTKEIRDDVVNHIKVIRHLLDSHFTESTDNTIKSSFEYISAELEKFNNEYEECIKLVRIIRKLIQIKEKL